MGRHKILLVDDNQELLRLLARLVDGEGWEPLPFPRGTPALEAIARENPAVAVVDVLLPDMLGYDVGKVLRAKEIPFLFMTGIFKGGRSASEARIQHGAAGYFEKPFEARRLLEAIRGLLPPEPVRGPSPAAANAGASDDFDVGVAVEPEETVDAVSISPGGWRSASAGPSRGHSRRIAARGATSRRDRPPASRPGRRAGQRATRPGGRRQPRRAARRGRAARQPARPHHRLLAHAADGRAGLFRAAR